MVSSTTKGEISGGLRLEPHASLLMIVYSSNLDRIFNNSFTTGKSVKYSTKPNYISYHNLSMLLH